MAYQNLGSLIDAIEEQLAEFKYFWDVKGETVLKQVPPFFITKQSAVVRMNCIDCLDRTNVVQACIAKHMLEKHIMKRLGIQFDSATSGSQEFEYTFKNAWANNGDFISQCYTGTEALKSDFTRKGERNLVGVGQDGMPYFPFNYLLAFKSLSRFYNNNLKDGFRQTAIDLALGNVRLNSSS
jgi:hypothetical protein